MKTLLEVQGSHKERADWWEKCFVTQGDEIEVK